MSDSWLPRADSETLRLRLAEAEAAATEAPVSLTAGEARRIAQLLATTLDGYILADDQGRILEVNAAYCRMIGYPREVLLRMNIHDVEAALSPEEIEVRIAEMVAAGSGHFETRHQRADGSEIDLDVSITLFFDEEVPLIAAFVRDITEQHRSQAALAASEMRYHRLMQSANDAIFLADTESGLLLDANDRAVALVGRSREELIGQPQTILHPPEGCERYRDTFRRHAATGRVIGSPTHVLHRDGRHIPVEISAATIDLPEGRIVQGIFRDLTPRLRAEAVERRLNRALRTYSACNHALVHATDEATFLDEICHILVTDGGYRMAWIGMASDNAERRVAPVARAGMGDDYLDTVTLSWGDNELGQGPMGRAIRTGETCVAQDLASEAGFEPWREAADASGFRATIALPLRDEGGGTFGGLVVYAETTDHFDPAEVDLLTDLADDLAYGITTLRARAAHQRDAERLRKLSAAVEQSPSVVLITDLSGAIEYVNPKFTAVSGYTPEEVVGKNPRILKSGETPAEAYWNLWHQITTGHEWRGEFHNRHKNGELYWEAASISPIRDATGAITHFVAVKEDITARKQAEEERRQLELRLRQAQKMETIGTLAGGIAHDFNNLLQGILGYADLGMEDTEEGSRARRDMERILTAGHRAKELVRQILTFSRQKEGQRQPVQLHPIIKEAIKLVRASIPAAVEIRENISTTCPPVFADLTQIHQVVMNLATNACHAMRENGGTLVVGLAMVEVEALIAAHHPGLRPGRHVRLTVSDTGHGMTAQTVARIFDPFFTTKGVDEGTGLGLSVVHGIVTTHDGAILVESEPGHGTTFDVYFPAIDLTQTQETTEAPAAIPGHERILYVDDDDEISALTHEMLSRLGYQVTRCNDAITALATFRGRPNEFDLLLADKSMGRMDGIHLIGECHVIRPDLATILMTGFSDKGVTKLLEERAISAVIQKPVLIRELSGELRKVLDGPPTEPHGAPDNGTHPDH